MQSQYQPAGIERQVQQEWAEKNAFRAIARAHKGDIKIWLVRGDKFNELHFRDTGTGIPANVLPRIFQRFYSWSKDSNVEQGTGVGLAFCKTEIEAMIPIDKLLLLFPGKWVTFDSSLYADSHRLSIELFAL